ncbi:MAG: acetyl-CoA carboxylase biotin carboxyl carrier protein subunit [Pseudomonadales bacterium]
MSRVDVESDVQGSVWKVEVAVGDRVTEGDVLVVLESMKMEIPVEAPADGVVTELLVAPEQAVEEGEVIAVLSA